MRATYTHVGGRAAVGYQHCGRDFAHYAKKTGRRHALSQDGYRRYRAVCGVVVAEDSDDSHDQGGDNPICKASEGVVTCKQCLARKPIVAPPSTRVEFRAMYESGGEVDCWMSSSVRAEAEQWEPYLRRQPGVSRVWIEVVTVVTTYRPTNWTPHNAAARRPSREGAGRRLASSGGPATVS